MKKIICFGDSITEMGFVIEVRGFVAQLADRYARRADVLVFRFHAGRILGASQR